MDTVLGGYHRLYRRLVGMVVYAVVKCLQEKQSEPVLVHDLEVSEAIEVQ